MRVLLVQKNLLKVLSGKNKLLKSMFLDEKEELQMKAHSTIQLFLVEEVRGRLSMKIPLSFMDQSRELVYD